MYIRILSIPVFISQVTTTQNMKSLITFISKNSFKKFFILYKKIISINLFAACVLYLIILYYFKEICSFWSVNIINDSYSVFIISLGYFFHIICGPSLILITKCNNQNLLLYSGLLSLCVICASFLTYPIYGYIALIISLSLAYILDNIFRILFMFKTYSKNYNEKY